MSGFDDCAKITFAPNAREGDLVRRAAHPDDTPLRVIMATPGSCHIANATCYDQGELVIVARPVRVGDHVRSKASPAHYFEVLRIHGESGRLRHPDGYERDFALSKNHVWEHANGLAIEAPPPAVLSDPPYSNGEEPAYSFVRRRVGDRLRPAPAPPSMSVDDLAKRLWLADPEAQRIVRERGDAKVLTVDRVTKRLQYEGQPHTVTYRSHTLDAERLEQAQRVAWRIDEGGFRTKWLKVAKDALAQSLYLVSKLEDPK